MDEEQGQARCAAGMGSRCGAADVRHHTEAGSIPARAYVPGTPCDRARRNPVWPRAGVSLAGTGPSIGANPNKGRRNANSGSSGRRDAAAAHRASTFVLAMAAPMPCGMAANGAQNDESLR